jgi:hypothetical protein
LDGRQECGEIHRKLSQRRHERVRQARRKQLFQQLGARPTHTYTHRERNR